MAKIGFIGMGNMGKAVLMGALKQFSKEDMVFSARTQETRRRVFEETGVEYADSNAECANRCKYLILAVKPQFYDEVLYVLLRERRSRALPRWRNTGFVMRFSKPRRQYIKNVWICRGNCLFARMIEVLKMPSCP